MTNRVISKFNPHEPRESQSQRRFLRNITFLYIFLLMLGVWYIPCLDEIQKSLQLICLSVADLRMISTEINSIVTGILRVPHIKDTTISTSLYNCFL